jgi:hypothetical protein
MEDFNHTSITRPTNLFSIISILLRLIWDIKILISLILLDLDPKVYTVFSMDFKIMRNTYCLFKINFSEKKTFFF